MAIARVLVRLTDEEETIDEGVLLSRLPAVGEEIYVPELGEDVEFEVVRVRHRGILSESSTDIFAGAVYVRRRVVDDGEGLFTPGPNPQLRPQFRPEGE